jgi:hypothetical protein
MQIGTERMPRFVKDWGGGRKSEPIIKVDYDGLREKKMGDLIELQIVEIIGIKAIGQMK